MKLLLTCIFNLLLLLSAVSLRAQDTTAVEINSGPSLYIDYGKLLTLPSDFETKYEGGLAWRFKNRIAINVQAGAAKVEPNGAFENGRYLSEGRYARAGINYLLPLDATNTLYVGLKYALAQYEERGSYEIGSTLWSTKSEAFARSNLQADWFEVIIGSEKRIKTSHWGLGGYFSLRILNSRDKFEPIDTYAIPGYGRAFDKTAPALNVYLRYSL